MKTVEREITDRDVAHVLIAAAGQESGHPDIRRMKCLTHGEGYAFQVSGTGLDDPTKAKTLIKIDGCCDRFLDQLIQACYRRSLSDDATNLQPTPKKEGPGK